jgi:UDP-3-O-[3-hydroxymyristoyl] glucosamine N-acyltransferase
MFAAEPSRAWTRMAARIRRIGALEKRVKKLEGK